MYPRSRPLRSVPALFTDLYELTMAHAFWRSGRSATRGAYELFFREQPFEGGLTIAAGLETVVGFLERFSFERDDLQYLASVPRADGTRLFSREFLEHLAGVRFSGDVDAVPEGTVVFPQEPILRVVAPLVEAQLVETALLNIVNFQTLIATKAARVVEAAAGAPVLEFGARRAQGVDGAVSASRAAYIGGSSATSNVLAGQSFGIPVCGTHAHSWVMAFDDELAAFRAFAESEPHNCVLLVDTYDTLRGVDRAIEVGKELRRGGRRLLGIRLDSGDLAALSIEARRRLDIAGLDDVQIIASGDLDEDRVRELRQAGARIDAWGVGTRLVTAWGQPALGGVYKLCAIERPDGTWSERLKSSDGGPKRTLPGRHGLRRFVDRQSVPLADALHADGHPPGRGSRLLHPDGSRPLAQVPHDAQHADLLVPVLRGGRTVFEPPSLREIREATRRALAAFRPEIRRHPEAYPVGITEDLDERRRGLSAGVSRRGDAADGGGRETGPHR